MGLSEYGDENIEERFNELCLDLNMDKATSEEAWLSYEKIARNFTLEVRYWMFLSTITMSVLRNIDLYIDHSFFSSRRPFFQTL